MKEPRDGVGGRVSEARRWEGEVDAILDGRQDESSRRRGRAKVRYRDRDRQGGSLMHRAT